MGYTKNNIEIEHKYVIKMPDIKELIQYYDVNHPTFKLLRQDYLQEMEKYKGFIGRVRAERIYSNYSWNNSYIKNENFYFTYKKYIGRGKRTEIEEKIDVRTYNAYMQYIDTSYMPILKRRICIPYTFEDGFHTDLEIDMYPFWHSQAILEIEVDSMKRVIPKLKGISIIKDVTDDTRYSNYSLAKHSGRVIREEEK